DVEIDYSKFTYGPKQTSAIESDSKPSKYASCESDSSVKTSTSMPELVKNAPKVVYEPKVWTDAPIIKEYESDSDDDSVSNVQEDKEKPSFAFTDSVKHKFLSSLPSSWSQVALIIRTKPGLDTLSFDDLYNNLRVFERDVKGTTTSSSNTQNVAFMSADNTSSTNDVSTAYSVSSPSVSKSHKEGYSSYTNEVIHSFFANQSSDPQLDYADLEQINDDDMEEMDLKWQVAIISMRIKKFYKRTETADLKGTKMAEEKMLEDIDWSSYVEEDTQNYVMMAYSSSNSGSDNEVVIRDTKEILGTKSSTTTMCDKKNKVLFIDTGCLMMSPDFKLPDENQVLLTIPRQHNMYSFNLKNINHSRDLAWLFAKASIDESTKWHRRLVENQANKSAGPKEANNSAGTQAKDDQGANSEEIDLHEEHFVMPIWSAYSTTVKSSRDKIEKNNDFNTCEKPVSQVEQIFLEELEKLKRHEKEANDASESPKKGATHDIQNASTSSTNLINTASTPLSTAGPSRAFNDGELLYLDDSLILTLRIFIPVQVWILVDLPFRKKAIGTKWVYMKKKDERGVVVRNKARLVTQGHRQEEGIEYDEVFAPVARIEAIRIFLAFASYMGFIVYQMDVKSAFLYGIIDEQVYVSQPPGFVDSKFPNKKSRYRKGAIDKTLFIKQDKKDIMLVQVYVDDIIFSFTKKSCVNTASTPIETHKPLVKDEEAADVDVHLYRFQVTPKSSHLQAVKRIFRDAYEKKLIHVLKIYTDDNVAALLTKAFDVSRLKFLFWNTATFKIVNNISQIHAKVVGKPVVITEASIRGDLLFDDVDRIDCLTNEAIFKNVALMGYEGDLTKLTFQKSLFSPQWKYLIHTIIHCLSSKSKITPLFLSMLTQAAVAEVKDSGTPIESQPTPSPTQPSARDEPPLIESSSDHLSYQDPRVDLEGTCGSKGDHVNLPHDSPFLDGHTSNRAEAKEILTLKARIKNLEKRCKTSISRHRAWLRSVSLLSKKNKLSKRKSVYKQGRKNAKTRPTKDDSDKLDAELDEDMEYMDTEEALNEGRQSTVGTARQDDDTARPDVSTARQDLSTARLDDNTARQGLSTTGPTTTPTTSTIFDDKEITLADTLIKLKDDKAKGVAFKDSKSTDKPVRLILTLKPLLKIDPKDKGKEYFERRKKQLAEERAVAIRNKPPTKTQLRRLMMTYLKNIDFVPIRSEEDERMIKDMNKKARERYPLTTRTLERMLSLWLIVESASDDAYDLLRFIQKQIDESGGHDRREKDL
nr:copia protein [Tanacetum cinerariifolium]